MLKLAWQYVIFNKTKSLILIACIFLTAILPISIRILLTQFENSFMRRADATPAVVGRMGSQLDLVLHGLYFNRDLQQKLSYSEVAKIQKTGLATPVPIYSAFQASKFPIVGTTLEYFQQRNLQLRAGNMLTLLGDCMLGSEVAKSLNVNPGDSLLSDRENVLDIAGKYPLKMRVVGVLKAAGSPDDQAVFVDLKTAWIIDGLGHGHQNLEQETDETKIMARDSQKIVASAAVLPFTQITNDNLDSFHFHGSLADFPISAILAFTSNPKNDTILQGIYDTTEDSLQLARPSQVVRQLMAMVFQVKRFFDANAALIAVSTILLLVLVILLSARLRKQEMETLFKIGCSRGTIVWLQAIELLIVLVAALTLVTITACCIHRFSNEILQAFIAK